MSISIICYCNYTFSIFIKIIISITDTLDFYGFTAILQNKYIWYFFSSIYCLGKNILKQKQ